MAILDFMKDVGEKLFGWREGKAEAAAPAGAGASAAEAGAAIEGHIRKLDLAPPDLSVSFDASSGVVSVSGTAPDQATRERIVLAAGNVQGVSKVDDRMTVTKTEPEARFYTVEKGDTLSKIAKSVYGDAGKYGAIFEANRPMLSDPDKIYPGQVLRIPPEK